MLNKVLTVDPGDNTGWAYWTGDRFPEVGQLNFPRKSKVIQKQFQFLWGDFDKLLKGYKPTDCYIEGVEVWAGSLASMASATRGNLMKLSYLIGGYCLTCELNHIRWHLIQPREWKGQLPNTAVQKRIARVNRQEYQTDHIMCAVGIGFGIMRIL